MSQADGVTFRAATVADAEKLTQLHLDCWDDAYTGLMPQQILDERRANAAARVATWRHILSGDETTWLADHEAGLVGFASAGIGRDNDVDLDLEVKALYVRAAWWGTGVGYALLRQAIGDRAAYLWVLAGNERGIGFYERQGFALDGTEDEHDEGLHVRMLRAGT
jgi:GNAT superfamily N-acetyltransferase